MDKYLAGQRASGRQESEGVFTMAVEKASWKLAEFRLSAPGLFPVHLAACAVASGATTFHVYRDPAGGVDTFRFDGSHFTQAALEVLESPLLGPGVPRHIQELGIALNAGGALGEIRFCSLSEKGGVEIVVQNGIVTISPVSQAVEAGQVLIAKYSGGLPSLEVLKERCAYAPLDLEIDGKRHRESFEFGMFENKLYGHYTREGSEQLMVRPPHLAEGEFFTHKERSQGKRSIAIALTWPAFASQHGWHFLVDGVSYRLPQEEFDFPFLCGAATASDLRLDVSRENFLDNQAFQAFRQEIMEACEELLERYCAQPASMSKNHLELFRNALLSHYKARILPSSIGEFLIATDDLAAGEEAQGLSGEPLGSEDRSAESGRETLEAVANAVLSSGDFSRLEEARAILRQRAAVAYRSRCVTTALAWLEREKFLLELAGVSGQSSATLIHDIRHIHDMAEVEAPEMSPPLESFRRLLYTMPGLSDQVISDELDSLSVDEVLKRPILFFLKRPVCPGGLGGGTATCPWALGLDLWSLCQARKFAEARGRLDRLVNPEKAIWLNALWSLYRGKMPWSQSVCWQGKIGVANYLERDSLSQRATGALDRILLSNRVVSGLFSEKPLESVLASLVAARTVSLVERGKRDMALAFLARYLLQLCVDRELL